MIYHVTAADSKMNISAKKCYESALLNGAEKSLCYIIECIEDEFAANNKEILNAERGAGYWLWKPYFINDAMKGLLDGDILIYTDAGLEFVADVREIINRMDEDIFLFTNGWPHIEWCKMNVAQAINGPFHVEQYKEYKQVQASAIFIKVNAKTRSFVREWLLWAQMPGFIDDSPSTVPNYPTFADHRHDQAILTCLQIKYGYKLHWWPTQYSNHLPRSAEDSYPVMFNHHRKRNNEW